MNISASWIAAALLLTTATITRFLAVFGTDPGNYGKMFTMYAMSQGRAAILVLYFMAIAYGFIRLAKAGPHAARVILVAALLFCCISWARTQIQVFLISAPTDALVVAWMVSRLRRVEQKEVV